MNFPLLKIIMPIWYYYLPNKNENLYWTNYNNLTSEQKKHIDYPNNLYIDQNMIEFDIIFQAFNLGFISQKLEKSNFTISSLNEIPLKDQYTFIRRMHKTIWVYYTFIIRILTLNNFLTEIRCFIKTRKIKKIKLKHPLNHLDLYKNFKSRILLQNPMLSIIIPTLNRYKYLKILLNNLEHQDYQNFEVIIIDQSRPFKKKFYDQFNLGINLVYLKQRALWKARNEGVKISKGEFLLFLDDDSAIKKNFISEHLKCIDYYKCDISSGVSISTVGAPIPYNYSYFRWSDQLDTGNVLIKKNVFRICGLFDTKFDKMRMGDAEFGARAFINNFTIISNPIASRSHLKIEIGGLREMGSWDGLRPVNFFSPRPIPSVLYLFKKYWGKNATLLYLLKTIPISVGPYKFKGRIKGYFISIFLFSLFFPVILIQIVISWYRSNELLNSKSKIKHIE